MGQRGIKKIDCLPTTNLLLTLNLIPWKQCKGTPTGHNLQARSQKNDEINRAPQNLKYQPYTIHQVRSKTRRFYHSLVCPQATLFDKRTPIQQEWISLGHPTFGVMYQLTDVLFRKCTYQPASATPQRARVRCFSFFAFTSSPYDCKQLGNSNLRVKASPLFPSPVKAKKGHFLHAQNTLYQ